MNISGFYEESMSNGIGWRAVLFVSGCPHKCKGCHNPETWNKDYGEKFDKDYYINKIKESDVVSGLTLSGGEPFLYPTDLLPIVLDARAMGLNVWAYTGYTLEELVEKNDIDIDALLANIDVLIDGKFIEEKIELEKRFIGSSNQRIINLNKVREGLSIKESLME